MKEYIKELEEAEKKEQEEMKLKEAEVEEARSEKKDDEEKKEEEVKENGDQNEGQMDIDDPEIIQLREQLSIEETVLGRIHIIFAIIEKFLSNFPLIEKYANAKFNIIDTDSNGVLSLSELAEFFNRDFDDKGWSKLGDRQAIMLMSRYDRDRNGTLSRSEFLPYIIDFFKFSRQALIIEYGKIKADQIAEELRGDAQWDTKGIAELERLFERPRIFYGTLRRYTLEVVNPIPEEIGLEEVTKICGEFCKNFGLPEIPQNIIEEIIKDTCATDKEDSFTQSDLRILSFIVINVSIAVVSILTA